MNANVFKSSYSSWNPIFRSWYQALRSHHCVSCSVNQIVPLTGFCGSATPKWWNNTIRQSMREIDAWRLQTLWLRHADIVITGLTLTFSNFPCRFSCTSCLCRCLTEVSFIVILIFGTPLAIQAKLSGSLSPRHGVSSGSGWRNSLQIWRVVRIYWISSRGQPTKGGPPAWKLGEVLTSPHLKNLTVLRNGHKSPVFGLMLR